MSNSSSASDVAGGRVPCGPLPVMQALCLDIAMAIDYLAASEKYRSEVIETLLVGEAPPPSGPA